MTVLGASERSAGRIHSDRTLGALFAVSIGLMLLVAGLGPSAAEPPLRTSHGGPPYFVKAHMPAWAVSLLLLVAFLAAGAMVAVALLRLRQGWTPRLRTIVAAGVIGASCFVLVPTIGSADYTNYSAYGHIENRGLDAYSIKPTQAARLGVPTAAAVEPPWQGTRSVYGPVSVRIEQVTAWLGGNSLRRTAFWLTVLHLLAFLATGWMLLASTRSETTRRRIALLWLANPLVIYQLVAGSHVDAIVVMLVVAALVVIRRSRVLAGAFVGLAVATKVNAALVGAAMAWLDRRSVRRLAALAIGAAATIGGFYLTISSHSLDQTRRASKFVSSSTPWWIVVGPLRSLLGKAHEQTAMTIAVLAVSVLVGTWLWRLVPGKEGDHRTRVASLSLVYVLAWLLAAPYLLPWYDTLAWGIVVLVAASTLDWLLLAHTTMLAIATLPGRDLKFHGGTAALIFALHTVISPLVLLGLMVWTYRAARRAKRQPDAPDGTIASSVVDLEVATGRVVANHASAGHAVASTAAPTAMPESSSTLPSVAAVSTESTIARDQG